MTGCRPLYVSSAGARNGLLQARVFAEFAVGRRNEACRTRLAQTLRFVNYLFFITIRK